MRYIVLLAVFFLPVNHCSGQQTVPRLMQKVVQQVTYDENVEASQSYIGKRVKAVSNLDRLQFRTETDDWDISRQEYVFRSSFKSKAMVQAEKSLISAWGAELSAEQQEYAERQIRDVYRRLIDMYCGSQELGVVRRKLALLRDRKAVKAVNIENGVEVDIVDVLELDAELYDLQMDSLAVTEEIASHQRYLSKYDETGAQVDFTSWADVTSLRQKAEAALQDGSVTTGLRLQEYDVNRKQLELTKEQAEADQVLDFMQLKYAGNDRTGIGNNFSVGFAMQLPTGHVNRTGISEAAIELYREQVEYERARQSAADDLQNSTAAYRSSVSQLAAIEDKIDALSLTSVLSKLAQLEEVRADALLDVQELILEDEAELIDKKRSLYRDYLDIMYKTGVLGGQGAALIFTKN